MKIPKHKRSTVGSGTKKTTCAIPGCEWREWGRQHPYGTYVGGEYYCREHAEEFEFIDGEWVRDGDKKVLTQEPN